VVDGVPNVRARLFRRGPPKPLTPREEWLLAGLIGGGFGILVLALALVLQAG
jgi:hypothetical protein